MIKKYSLIKETKEIKVLERFVIDNIRNSALNIQYPWCFSNVKDEADELFVLNTLLDNGEFSISDHQKKLLEQGLEQHYFDENKLYKLPIEDQLYRHYDEVLIPIREFKKFIASDDYRKLLENKILGEVELKSIQKSFKQAQANYQKAFQFYALHVNCRSVEPPKEILTKIKNIQAQAYKDREIKEMIHLYLKPEYKNHVENFLIENPKKSNDIKALFDSEIDAQYKKNIMKTLKEIYDLKLEKLVFMRNRYTRAQNAGSFSYIYQPRKKSFKEAFIKTGINYSLQIKRLDDRINNCIRIIKDLKPVEEASSSIIKNIFQHFDQWKYEIQDDTNQSLYDTVNKYYKSSKKKK